jgi:RsmE family RNA methyltransferase
MRGSGFRVGEFPSVSRGGPAVNLVILEPDEVDPDGLVRLTGARAVHVRQVLRLGPRDQMRIGLLDGPLGIGIVEDVDEGLSVRLRCRFDAATPVRPAVDLLLALPRPKVMRRLWAQLAALGVDRIMLTNAGRVERQYFDTHLITPEVYRPLLVEGLQQAKDTRLPRVSIHRRLKPLIEDDLDGLSTADIRLLAEPSAPASAGAAIKAKRASRALVAVGPEGGWSAFEHGLLTAHGFESIGIGGRTLRTDTACIALLAVVHGALRSGVDPSPGA